MVFIENVENIEKILSLPAVGMCPRYEARHYKHQMDSRSVDERQLSDNRLMQCDGYVPVFLCEICTGRFAIY